MSRLFHDSNDVPPVFPPPASSSSALTLLVDEALSSRGSPQSSSPSYICPSRPLPGPPASAAISLTLSEPDFFSRCGRTTGHEGKEIVPPFSFPSLSFSGFLSVVFFPCHKKASSLRDTSRVHVLPGKKAWFSLPSLLFEDRVCTHIGFLLMFKEEAGGDFQVCKKRDRISLPREFLKKRPFPPSLFGFVCEK